MSSKTYLGATVYLVERQFFSASICIITLITFLEHLSKSKDTCQWCMHFENNDSLSSDLALLLDLTENAQHA